MEKSINGFIKDKFNLSDIDIKTYSPLTLAYIGDSIYDLIIRSMVVDTKNTQANKLHNEVSGYVKAEAQAVIMDEILGDLTDEEINIYNRGRNAKQKTFAKNASMSDYKKATGFEALIGFLYLSGLDDRMMELILKGVEIINS